MNKTNKIKIFDNLVCFEIRNHILSFLQNSHFKTNSWQDTNDYNFKNNVLIHSFFSKEDDEKCGLLSELKKNYFVNNIVNNLEHDSSVINLSVPTDYYFPHVHTGYIVVLYYANLIWHHHWHGETLFYDDNAEEVIFTSIYKPGRIVIFDGDIPHSIRPQSVVAQHHRFTYSMFFKKNNEDINWSVS